MIPGVQDRLTHELQSLVPSTMALKVVAPRCLYSPWLGGSMLSVLSTFKSGCLLKGTYAEVGPSLVSSYFFM